MDDGRAERRLEYPVTDEIPAEHPDYQSPDRRLLSRGGRRARGAAARRASRSACWPKAIRSSTAPSCICGGGWTPTSRSRSCPASPACRAAGRAPTLPITWGNDTLTVLPGTLREDELVERLRHTDAAVIMKVGRNLAEGAPRRRDARACCQRAVYVERGTMQDERILPLAECGEPDAAPISRWC